jgi:hypothetical protein
LLGRDGCGPRQKRAWPVSLELMLRVLGLAVILIEDEDACEGGANRVAEIRHTFPKRWFARGIAAITHGRCSQAVSQGRQVWLTIRRAPAHHEEFPARHSRLAVRQSPHKQRPPEGGPFALPFF